MNVEAVIAYVGIGSNLGDRAGNLLLAVRGLLEASMCLKRLSAIYETEPVGVKETQLPYLNMIAEVEVKNITPEQMLARMLRVEYLLGRRRESPKAARTVDLDLILFGKNIYQTDFLSVPHPQMQQRRFVLVPLNELAPDLRHPVLQKTIAELLAETPDKSNVRRWNPIDANCASSSTSQFPIAKEPVKI
ncbi:MAG: 2-amino-4-hydroxy-6-hydroxymethyldihydropteridine diphosphokinase [Acidobacteriota bacterium]|nr:2-amino-4-hydroxy-6-hydroxymethyldihydropteridine diphosphokinase [Acidobacteriota bacterium]